MLAQAETSDNKNKERNGAVRILVTGGAGYIGGTVAGLLLKEGHEVAVLDNLKHGRREMVPSAAEFVEAELADRDAVERVLRSGVEAGKAFAAVL